MRAFRRLLSTLRSWAICWGTSSGYHSSSPHAGLAARPSGACGGAAGDSQLLVIACRHAWPTPKTLPADGLRRHQGQFSVLATTDLPCLPLVWSPGNSQGKIPRGLRKKATGAVGQGMSLEGSKGGPASANRDRCQHRTVIPTVCSIGGVRGQHLQFLLKLLAQRLSGLER